MSNTHRHPSRIQKELQQLEELMRDNRRLVGLYPDDFGLKLNLSSLENREDDLLIEFKESSKYHHMDLFDISIEGIPVVNNSISVSAFGETLVKIQELVHEIAHVSSAKSIRSPINKKILDASAFSIAATAAGSFRVILTTNQPQIGNSLVIDSLEKFNDLIDCVDNKELIIEQTHKLGKKSMGKYKNLLKILFKHKIDVQLYDKVRPDAFHSREIAHVTAKRVYDALTKQEETSEEIVEYYGILKALNLLSYNCEFLADNVKIKATFDEGLAPEVKKHIDVFSTAKFNASTKWNEVTEEEMTTYKLVSFTD